MPAREGARQTARDRMLCAQRGASGVGSEIDAAHLRCWSGEPIASGTSLCRSCGGLEVVPGGGAARGRPRPQERNVQETLAALAPVRDGSLPTGLLLWAAAALLLEMIADDAPCDSDASMLDLARDLGLAEPDRVLFPALIRVTAGLLGRHAWHGPAGAALAYEVANLPGKARRPAPPPGQPVWPGEPLTEGENRVLRYLPTHMHASEIAAELYLSANTVKTHLRHLYRKLGAHSRQEAVQRACAIGLLTVSSRR
jgi:LuxR family transcriptional regulator, maltose regulon positive regulatory protein